MKEFATCAHAIRGTTGGAQQNKLAAPAASALEVIRRQPKSEVHPMTDRYDTAQAHALMGREGFSTRIPRPAVQPDAWFQHSRLVWDVRYAGSYQLPNIVRPAPEASLNGKLYPPQYNA